LAQENSDNVVQQKHLLSRAVTFRHDILTLASTPEVLRGSRNLPDPCSPQSIQLLMRKGTEDSTYHKNQSLQSAEKTLRSLSSSRVNGSTVTKIQVKLHTSHGKVLQFCFRYLTRFWQVGFFF